MLGLALSMSLCFEELPGPILDFDDFDVPPFDVLARRRLEKSSKVLLASSNLQNKRKCKVHYLSMV